MYKTPWTYITLAGNFFFLLNDSTYKVSFIQVLACLTAVQFIFFVIIFLCFFVVSGEFAKFFFILSLLKIIDDFLFRSFEEDY